MEATMSAATATMASDRSSQSNPLLPHSTPAELGVVASRFGNRT